jgi:hypothetical protein
MVIALPVTEDDRHIGLAEDHCARRLDAGDRDRVLLDLAALQCFRKLPDGAVIPFGPGDACVCRAQARGVPRPRVIATGAATAPAEISKSLRVVMRSFLPEVLRLLERPIERTGSPRLLAA